MRWVWTVAVAVVAGLVGTALALGSGHQVNTAYSSSSSRVPLLGATSVNNAQLARNTAEFGHMPIIHKEYKRLPPGDAWTRGPLAECKSAVVVSFNAPPSKIISGADNRALSHFFDTAPTGHPIYYTYIHEPEHEVFDGRLNLAAYKAAWPHIVRLARAAHNPYLKATLILMGYDLHPAVHRDWRSFIPGGHIIDVLAWDSYGRGGTRVESPAQLFAPSIAASKSVGLPYGFAEFGMRAALIRASWLDQVGSYLIRSGALFGTLFDSPWVHPTFMMSNPAAIAAWRRWVQASARGNRIPVPPGGHHRTTASPGITGLSLSRATLAPGGGRGVTIAFRLTRPADVTVLVLNGGSRVTRLLARPRQAAGQVQVSYNGDGSGGKPAPAGTYQVLVVASNSRGSATAEAPLTIRG